MIAGGGQRGDLESPGFFRVGKAVDQNNVLRVAWIGVGMGRLVDLVCYCYAVRGN